MQKIVFLLMGENMLFLPLIWLIFSGIKKAMLTDPTQSKFIGNCKQEICNGIFRSYCDIACLLVSNLYQI